MADTKKIIEVELIANAKKLKDEFKATAKDAIKLQENLGKSGSKADKASLKIAKDYAKLNKREGVAALKTEKQLLSVLKSKSATLRDMHKSGQRNTDAFKKEKKSLEETAALYAEIKKSRKAIYGPTQEEKPKSGGSGFGKAVAGVAGLALGAVVGAITSRVTEAIDAANQYNSAAVESLGDKKFDKVARERAERAGKEAGFDAIETMKNAGMVARQTGRAEDVGQALKFSRSAMIDPSRSAGFMGMQARGGVLGSQARKEQEKIIAAGFRSGLERGRLGEMIDSLTGLAEKAQSRTAGDVSTDSYAGILAAFGATGKSGFKGSRGAKVLEQLEQGVMTPGGGEAGQALVLRSKGFGVPGGTTSYYDAIKRQEKGFAGEKGAEELKGFIDYLQTEFGYNSQEAALAIRETTGITATVAEDVMKLVNGFKGNSGDMMKRIGEMTKGSVPMDEQVKDILKDEVAEALKVQNEITKDLVNQGQVMMPYSLAIKQEVHNMVTALVDVAIPALIDIKNAVESTYHWFKDGGSLSTGGQPAKLTPEYQAKLEALQVKNKFGDDTEGLLAAANRMVDKDADTIANMSRTRGPADPDLMAHRKHREAFQELAEQAQYKLEELKKLPTTTSTKTVKDMTPAEYEAATARGVSKGMQGNNPVVNVPAPVVKTNITTTGPARVQHR